MERLLKWIWDGHRGVIKPLPDFQYRTSEALERRGLVVHYFNGWAWVWDLTEAGRALAEEKWA